MQAGRQCLVVEVRVNEWSSSILDYVFEIFFKVLDTKVESLLAWGYVLRGNQDGVEKVVELVSGGGGEDVSGGWVFERQVKGLRAFYAPERSTRLVEMLVNVTRCAGHLYIASTPGPPSSLYYYIFTIHEPGLHNCKVGHECCSEYSRVAANHTVV